MKILKIIALVGFIFGGVVLWCYAPLWVSIALIE
jgi:hypothetical protein